MAVDVGRTGIWSSSRAWPKDGGAAADAAAELDDLGYQALWLGAAAPSLDLPAALLAATSRMALATGIVSVWSAPAATVAASFHEVAAAHPGRFLLGLGASHESMVNRGGQEYRHPYRKLVEYLDDLDAASPPVPQEDRALAALGPRVLALAGERTAGAHPYLVTPEHTREAREILGDGPLLAPEQKVILETDPLRAREIAREFLHLYLRLPNYTTNLIRLGFTEDDISQPTDRLVDALVAWGEDEAIARRITEHREAGADHVCVQVLTGDPAVLPREQWRRLAAIVS